MATESSIQSRIAGHTDTAAKFARRLQTDLATGLSDDQLIQAFALTAQEAALTGESTPAAKDPDVVLPAETALGDRRNMGYMGTVIASWQRDSIWWSPRAWKPNSGALLVSSVITSRSRLRCSGASANLAAS